MYTFDGVYDFSMDGQAGPQAVDATMSDLELPANIPFDGQPIPYDTADNVSEAELGLMEAM